MRRPLEPKHRLGEVTVIASKFLVHTPVGTAQAGVTVAVFRRLGPGPTPAFGLDATTTTMLPLAGTVVCSMALGLLISATADRRPPTVPNGRSPSPPWPPCAKSL
ncbi:hypothetical protein ACFW2X_12650 [Streptomyces antibioticus]|uniref:hypothetical protein n=1 Tax=Streptomyces antibioticus TaxID=1890 RepID=UPI0036B51120